MSRHILSDHAKLDLQQIWNYIAEDNIDAADRVRDELRSAMRQLAETPGIGHTRVDVSDRRIRFWSVYSYLIAYVPDSKPLTIVRVVHGARNIKAIFRKKPPRQ